MARLGIVSSTLITASLVATSAFSGPVTQTPTRPLTDPASITSDSVPGAAPVPIADLYFVRGGRDATWTADGKAIVFSTNITGRYNLWTVPAEGGFPLQLTQSDDRQSGIAITPDGRVIFQSDRAGAEIYDLYAVPLAGGETVNLTHTPDVDEQGAVVSKDGRWVAYESRLKERPQIDIAVMDLATGAPRLMTSEPAPDRPWIVAGMTEDGRTLIANRSDSNDIKSAVYAIDMASGQQIALTPDGDANNVASAVSPDGRKVALTTVTADGVKRAAILDVASRKVTLLKPDVWEQSSGVFSPDGGSLIFSSNIDGRTRLYRYDVKAGASAELPMPEGWNELASANTTSFSPDGTKLLLAHQSSNTPFDYWVFDLSTGQAKPITRLGLASIAPQRLPEAKVVHYKSADGTVISALLWVPFNLKRDGTAPAVVFPHGGPTDQRVDTFSPYPIALASRGYLVIAPNPRGSTGYGKAFEDANHDDLGGGDLDDEVAGVKFLIATGYVDPKRVGIMGGSYGGYMTLMAVAKTPDIWAAAVEQYGVIDWATMYRTSAPWLQQYLRGLIRNPDKNAEVYRKSSPMTYIDQEKAPLLVLQGDNDIRVPRGQAEQVIAKLKANGRIVDAHFYPNEGHGFVKRENQIDALQRTIDWFDKYLQPKR
jgi:dipeptidyl aminopeptidase/acylaminoacyl peptidase